MTERELVLFERLKEAARRECQTALENHKTGYTPDDSGVPVWIPVDNKKGPLGQGPQTAFDIFLEIVGGIYVSSVAKNPEEPTTFEIADAETILSEKYFVVLPFDAWRDENV